MFEWLRRNRRDETAETRSLENPSVPLSDVTSWHQMVGEWNSVATVNVTAETLMEVPAGRCAVNFLSGTIASLPLQLFARSTDGHETADRDPLYYLLHDSPNPEWTSFAFRKHLMVNILVRGRGLAFIERNKAGRVMNLWPLETDKTTIERKEGRKLYRYRDGKREVVYAASEVIDLPYMLQSDGVSHVNPVHQMRGAIGLSVALENYAQRFFANGGVPPLVLQGAMPSSGAAPRVSADITKAIRDANEERRNVLIMPAGHELKPVGIDPEKSQMESARRFQIEEIARAYNLPPVFLQDLTHGTFSNTEQQDLHFVKHTLTQWVEAWEQELNLKLFSARNRKNFVEFNVDGLLRGDFKTRFEGYAAAVQNGINTPNEIRRMENWPQYGPEANRLYVQGATVPLGTQAVAPVPTGDAEPTEPEDDANGEA